MRPSSEAQHKSALQPATEGKDIRSYDDPSFPEPIRAALFEEDGVAYLVWNRREG